MRTRIGGVFALGVLALVALGSSVSAAGAATDHEPVVVIVAGPGTVTSIRVEFDSAESDDEARTVFDDVAAALGTSAHPTKAAVKHGVRRYSFNVDLATHDAFAKSRIRSDVLQKIADSSHEPVYLEMRDVFHVARGDVTKVEGGINSRYRVDPDQDIVYGMGATPILAYLLLLVAVVLIAMSGLRRYALRVEHGTGEPADRAHRLQRVSTVGVFVMLGLAVLVLITGLALVPTVLVMGAFPRTAGWRALAVIGPVFGFLVPVIVCGVAFAKTIQPSYRRIRGIERKPSRRMLLAAVLMGAMPGVLIGVTRGVGSQFGPAGTIAGFAIYFAVILTLWPSLLVHILPTRAADPELAARFHRLCDRQHVRIGQIRILEGKRTKTANAMLLGVGRFRYVLITDYLLENLDADALDAVVMHEIGHAKQHHLLKKLGFTLGSVLLFVSAVALVVEALHLPSGIVGFAFVVGFPIALIVTNGWIGIRLETKADDFAAETVSPDALRRGLDCVAELNMAKRRTGRVWNLLTQHPGFQQRLDRLTKQAAASPNRELVSTRS